MSTIQLKRGLKVNLPTLGAGELAFTTDDHLVYVGDGANNYLVGRVIYGSGDPVGNGVAGNLYVNTTTSGIFLSQGAGWMGVGGLGSVTQLSQLSGTLDNIADGSTYKRVLASDMSSGHVNQISDGTHTVTASDGRAHIDDATKHRQISDGTTSTTTLWSSQKTSDTIGSVVRGVDWQDSVISYTNTTSPPGSPSDYNRYLIPAGAGDAWSSHTLSVAEYITASGGWVYMPPNEGWATWVEDEDKLYIYNGSSWVAMSSVIAHNSLSGLQGGTTNEYYHLTSTDYSSLVTNRTETVQDIVGGFMSGDAGITVYYNDTLNILTVSGNLAIAAPGTVSSSSTGAVGTSTNLARQDHNHNLGTHAHTGSSDGGQVSHASLASIGANDHHNQQHVLTGTDHTATGLTIGHVLRATDTTTFAFGALIDTDLPTHHSRHQHGGNDEVATATPAANAIPKSTSSSDLNGWITSVDGGTF